MNNIDQLKSYEALLFIRDYLQASNEQIAILEDERDEYRRKWLEAIKDTKGNDDNTLQAPNKQS